MAYIANSVLDLMADSVTSHTEARLKPLSSIDSNRGVVRLSPRKNSTPVAAASGNSNLPNSTKAPVPVLPNRAPAIHDDKENRFTMYTQDVQLSKQKCLKRKSLSHEGPNSRADPDCTSFEKVRRGLQVPASDFTRNEVRKDGQYKEVRSRPLLPVKITESVLTFSSTKPPTYPKFRTSTTYLNNKVSSVSKDVATEMSELQTNKPNNNQHQKTDKALMLNQARRAMNDSIGGSNCQIFIKEAECKLNQNLYSNPIEIDLEADFRFDTELTTGSLTYDQTRAPSLTQYTSFVIPPATQNVSDAKQGHGQQTSANLPRHRRGRYLKKSNLGPGTDRGDNSHKFSRSCAPIGILGKLNPGIINKLRDRHQVRAALGAVIGTSLMTATSKEHTNISLLQKPNVVVDGGIRKESEQSMMLPFSQQILSASDLMDSLDDPLLEDKSGVSCSSTGLLNFEQSNIITRDTSAANLMSCWLELLKLDIKGRLAALRRSRRRVRGVILSSKTDNNLANKTMSELDDAQRWKSFFFNMDGALSSEGTRLETWLNQINEMQSQCQNQVSLGFPHLPVT